ncbi:hypothetical protein niasHT_024747 [Heterodera trifolii]|uniref:Ubiquitin-like domain-containing protein n=1 Tax=Heterodera trifolii TaxID=157864 RepID=A0ABD2KNQ7_9BILA
MKKHWHIFPFPVGIAAVLTILMLMMPPTIAEKIDIQVKLAYNGEEYTIKVDEATNDVKSLMRAIGTYEIKPYQSICRVEDVKNFSLRYRDVFNEPLSLDNDLNSSIQLKNGDSFFWTKKEYVINVHYGKNTVYTVSVGETDLVYNLKRRIANATGLMPTEQTIIVGNCVIVTDEATMYYYGIENNTELHVTDERLQSSKKCGIKGKVSSLFGLRKSG